MSAGGQALRALIHLYQGWSRNRLPHCRYVPSCSEYADEAIAVYGPARGTWLAVRRVARCRPGGGFGYDPVPEPTAGAGRRGSWGRRTRVEACDVE